jgi:hypothetical protein
MPEGTSYVNPVLTADHKWLHLEARETWQSARCKSCLGCNGFIPLRDARHP